MPSMDDFSVQYSEIDAHVKEAPADVGTSFLRLKDYILSACQPGKYQTLFLFRGIFMWLLNNYTRTGLDPTEESPISLIREYQCHNITINTVIDAICRIFDVPSTAVHGIAKPYDNDLGRGYVDTRENKRCSWNAINIDGKWFLLNTNILFPPKEENHSRDATGNRNRTEQTRSLTTGPDISFDPFWFLTDPKDFIFFCYPEEPSQQYLQSADLVEYGDFLKGPILHPGFFRYKLDIVSDKVCHLFSKDGLCFISLYTDKTIATTLNFSCDIWSVIGSEANKLNADENSRTVRWFRSTDIVIFKFVFSDKGRYRAVLSCQDVKTDLLERCCEFEIDCEKKYAGDRPRLPKFVSTTGFGIGPSAVKAGIMSSSHKYSVVLVNPVADQNQGAPGKLSKEHCLKFQISEEALEMYSYDTRLCSFDNLGREQEYKGCVHSRISEKRSEMEVRVKIPAKNMDYVLSTRATEKGCRDNGKVPPVCNYLLTTSLDDQEEMEIKKAEKNVKQIKKQRSFRILKDVQNRLEEEVHRLKGEIKQLKELYI